MKMNTGDFGVIEEETTKELEHTLLQDSIDKELYELSKRLEHKESDVPFFIVGVIGLILCYHKTFFNLRSASGSNLYIIHGIFKLLDMLLQGKIYVMHICYPSLQGESLSYWNYINQIHCLLVCRWYIGVRNIHSGFWWLAGPLE